MTPSEGPVDCGDTGTASDRGPRLARLDRPRTDRQVRIAVVSDPHVAVEGVGTWKVCHRSHERFVTALRDAGTAADAVLLPGDLTNDGRRTEFDAVDGILADLDTPWAAVPGNHDVRKSFDDHEGVGTDGFARRYAPDGFPFVFKIGSVTLLCVNTASADGDLRHTWGGRVSENDRTWLAEQFAAAEVPVLVCHHNLAPLPENPGGKWEGFPLEDGSTVRDLLAAHDVPLAVTGHHHVPAVARHGPTVELLAPATCSFPQAWLLLEIGPTGTTVRLVPAADGHGQAEAYRLATTGKALGRGIAELGADRLVRLPLLNE